jgi:dihydroxyacid dehydratase/phosphogluconate dehydratase
MHIGELAREACAGVDAAGGKSVLFNTITVSDGISMGTPGMRYSLVSREIIADSIETVAAAAGFDGFVAIGGCDKNMPGCAMAMARLNRPAVFVYGGTIRPEQARDIISVFEAVGRAPRHALEEGCSRSAHRHRPRQLRRHVHREHHGLRRRGLGLVLTRQLRPGGSVRQASRLLRAGEAVVGWCAGA